MKRLMLICLLVLPAIFNVYSEESEPNDTTVFFRDKMIHIRDSIDQVNIKISSRSANTDEPYKTVFEGIYSDRRSYERWTVSEELGLQLPLIGKHLKKKKKNNYMEAHWAGIGLGFAAMTDGSAYNDIEGMSLILGKSKELNINFAEHIIPLLNHYIGLTTGFGFSSRSYYLENYILLKQTNGIVYPSDERPFNYMYSKLRNWYLTIPVLIEIQPFNNSFQKLYLAAGVVGGIKLSTVYKSKYYSTSNTAVKIKCRDMNVLPVTYDYMIIAGCNNISLYGKYSPIGIFEDGKGPKVQHTSIGLMLNF
jgi:hypothetical protein